MTSLNEQNLQDLIKDNINTQFGKKHDFHKIHTREDYKKYVPLSDYRDYKEDFDRIFSGEEDVLVSYPVVGFCQSSGTDDTSKRFLYTEEQVRRYNNHMVWFADEAYQKIGGKRLLVNCFRIEAPVKKDKNYLFSELYHFGMKEYTKRSYEAYVGGEDCIFSENATYNLYIKTWLAFLEPDVRIFEGIYLYDILMLCHYIECHWAEVIDDICQRKVGKNVPPHIEKILLDMPWNEERLEEIQRECEKGFEGIINRLWKGVKLLVGISAPNFFAENKGMEFYAKGVDQYLLCYAASEGYIGDACKQNSFHYRLIQEGGVYEFLPCDEAKETGNTVWPEEVVQGELYEPVISNFAGLYRYRMGDIVKCVGRDETKGVPVFEYVGRRHHRMNAVGEKMEATQLESVIRDLDEAGYTLEQYCFSITLNELPKGYVLVATEGKCGTMIDETFLAEKLDEALKKENVDYADLRQMGYLIMPKCILLTAEEFLKFRQDYKLSEGHGKPKHILKDGLDLNTFLS